MRKSTLMFTSWLMLSAVTLQSGTVFAADAAANIRADAANGQVIFNEGKGDASACIGCHGEKGLGMDAMSAPRLANIGQVYIVKQLANFANDLYVPSGMGAVMNGIGKALSDQDRRDVAAYLESLEYEIESSDLKALATDGIKVGKPEQGKILVSKGIKGRVPACQDCHGFNGRAPHIPALNQQKYVYLVNQLNNYRDGTRTSDPKVNKIGIMQGIAKKLSQENIMDIAAFLSTAPRITP
ncbi:MAG: c-type cytochrome [Gallionella sp.]|nr:c-type cytochrome [Gallionella sp.]